MIRRIITLAALAATAVGMTGCFPLIDNERGAQQDLVGDVKLSADVCESPALIPYIFLGSSIAGDARKATLDRITRRAAARGVKVDDIFACPAADDVLDALDNGAPFAIPHQTIVAYRVPAGAKAPDTFTATAEVAQVPDAVVLRSKTGEARIAPGLDVETANQTISFRREPQVDGLMPDWLGGFAAPTDDPEVKPLNDGQKFVGYISDVIPGVVLGQYQLSTRFGLPAGPASDQPYAGPFNHLLTLGTRIAGTPEQLGGAWLRSARGISEENPFDPARPVVCLGDDSSLNEAQAFCPYPRLTEEGPTAESLKGDDLATRDFVVVGDEGYGYPGSTARVPFKLREAGPEALAYEIQVTGTTTLPGATVTPQDQPTRFEGTGGRDRPLIVSVPDNATPGTYDVSYTGKIGDVVRKGAGKLVVLAKPVTAPVVKAEAPSGSRDNLYLEGDSTAFGYVCDDTKIPCGPIDVTLLSSKNGIDPTATTAAVQKPRLLRIGQGRFTASTSRRVRAKVKVVPKARNALKRGRSIKALVVIRGADGVPVVRRVILKAKRK